MSVLPFNCPSVQLSIHPFIHSNVHPFIRPSISHSVSLPVSRLSIRNMHMIPNIFATNGQSCLTLFFTFHSPSFSPFFLSLSLSLFIYFSLFLPHSLFHSFSLSPSLSRPRICTKLMMPNKKAIKTISLFKYSFSDFKQHW